MSVVPSPDKSFFINHPQLQLMVQGTTSDAGKSTLVCALGRIFHQAGKRAAPFKPQNMALNSAVTEDGGEIGRAQALQAQACGIKPHTDMNPVLLKPSSDTGSQIIIQGKAIGHQSAADYGEYKKIARSSVLESYQRLRHRHDILLIEGAGSPAEVNLRENDIANMGFAENVDCPVVLIADIDRGGVFAHIIGTLACLSETEQKRIIGFVINRFRGDISLLQPGIDWLEEKTGKPVLAVLPYLRDLYLDAEDSLSLQQINNKKNGELNVVIPLYPRISNHTDFDALRVHPQINLIFVASGQTPPPADLIILPGSKNTRDDLRWLQQQPADWAHYINKHLRYGGKVIGICGGLQMLGKKICDPLGIEGNPGGSTGLNILDITTELTPEKILTQKYGKLNLNDHSAEAQGYEIHAGISTFNGLKDAGCGWLSADNQVFATYWHGIFDTAGALSLILRWAGMSAKLQPDFISLRDKQLNRLANEVAKQLQWQKFDEALKHFYNNSPTF